MKNNIKQDVYILNEQVELKIITKGEPQQTIYVTNCHGKLTISQKCSYKEFKAKQKKKMPV